MRLADINNAVDITRNSLTSFDPHILPELGRHAHKKMLSLFIFYFMEVVTSAA